MEWMNEMWRRLVFLFRRRRMEEELAEEMRLHVELRAVEDGADGRAAPVWERDLAAGAGQGSVGLAVAG